MLVEVPQKKPKDFEKSKQQWRPQLQQGPRGPAHPHSHKVLLCNRVESLRDEERRRRGRLMLSVHLDKETSQEHAGVHWAATSAARTLETAGAPGLR